jgi:serine/threonine-protein kinase
VGTLAPTPEELEADRDAGFQSIFGLLLSCPIPLGPSPGTRRMDPLIGIELDGRYRLVALLGEGAMGRVYRADRLDGTGQVAVKVLNEDCTEQVDLRERFEREARALFGLQHPHILDVQDYGVINGRQPYLVMELLEGQSLDEMVDAETLDPPTALEIARQLLVGLAHAHGQGVLHRDLKTENIFVVRLPEGGLRAKLLDFGLVKFVDDERWGEGRKLTVAGSVMGSPAYMSPEQGTGGPMNARSDVYSAGVVLYELVTGNWPFEAESRVEMLKSHLLDPVPPFSQGRSDLKVRPELDALLQRAMAKEPAARFADAREMLAALEAIPQPAAWLEAPPAQPAGSLPVHAAFPSGALPPAGPAHGVIAAYVEPAPPAAYAPLPAPPLHAAPLQPALVAAPVASPSARNKLPFILAGIAVAAFCGLGMLVAVLAVLLR